MKADRHLRYGLTLLIILSAAAVIWFKNENGDFLPEAHIAIERVRWNGDIYSLCSHDKCYFEVDKPIAKDGSYRLYSLKGDINHEYNTVAKSDGDNADELYVKSGYRIPGGGKVTGAVINRYSEMEFASTGSKFINEKKINLLFEGLEKAENKMIAQEEVDLTGYNFYRIYLCYNRSPVSSGFFADIGVLEDHIIIITEEISPIYYIVTEDDSGTREQKLKTGIPYVYFKDAKISRMMKGLKLYY